MTDQMGDCVDCGRNAEHRWHTKPGYGTIGDGMIPHKYNPKGDQFEYLLPGEEFRDRRGGA